MPVRPCGEPIATTCWPTCRSALRPSVAAVSPETFCMREHGEVVAGGGADDGRGVLRAVGERDGDRAVRPGHDVVVGEHGAVRGEDDAAALGDALGRHDPDVDGARRGGRGGAGDACRSRPVRCRWWRATEPSAGVRGPGCRAGRTRRRTRRRRRRAPRSARRRPRRPSRGRAGGARWGPSRAGAGGGVLVGGTLGRRGGAPGGPSGAVPGIRGARGLRAWGAAPRRTRPARRTARRRAARHS